MQFKADWLVFHLVTTFNTWLVCSLQLSYCQL